MKRTGSKTLVSALRILSKEVVSGDGVANAVIAEGADRIEEFMQAIEDIRDTVLYERGQLTDAGMDNHQVNAVLDVIDEHNPEPLYGEDSDAASMDR